MRDHISNDIVVTPMNIKKNHIVKLDSGGFFLSSFVPTFATITYLSTEVLTTKKKENPNLLFLSQMEPD